VKATRKVNEQYADRVNPLRKRLEQRGADAPKAAERKELQRELKQLEEAMERDIRKMVKEGFDYEIPIAQVEKAGISSTGAVIDNELKPLAGQFKEYREKNGLWEQLDIEVTYSYDDEDSVRRNLAAEDIEIYG